MSKILIYATHEPNAHPCFQNCFACSFGLHTLNKTLMKHTHEPTAHLIHTCIHMSQVLYTNAHKYMLHIFWLHETKQPTTKTHKTSTKTHEPNKPPTTF